MLTSNFDSFARPETQIIESQCRVPDSNVANFSGADMPSRKIHKLSG
jgi:hypothetical protein